MAVVTTPAPPITLPNAVEIAELTADANVFSGSDSLVLIVDHLSRVAAVVEPAAGGVLALYPDTQAEVYGHAILSPRAIAAKRRYSSAMPEEQTSWTRLGPRERRGTNAYLLCRCVCRTERWVSVSALS